MLTVAAGPSPMDACLNLSSLISDDDIVEATEGFRVDISEASLPEVQIQSPSTSNVVITDKDCKCTSYLPLVIR